mmetsp:Transcript_30565/g.85744  ORF Transcript_30565/g.85744 Transcript_30565/m.85744 type:complete len:382 (-) Transcript_30565:468-1613(-)
MQEGSHPRGSRCVDRPGPQGCSRICRESSRRWHPRCDDHRGLREDRDRDRKAGEHHLAGRRHRRVCVRLQQVAPERRLHRGGRDGRYDEEGALLRAGEARRQAHDREVAPAAGVRERDDRRRRERRARAQRGHDRRGHGRGGNGGGQGRGRDGAAGRQLHAHRGRGREGPRHLRGHPEVRGLHHVGAHRRGDANIFLRRRGAPYDAPASPNPVPHPGDRPAPLSCAGHGAWPGGYPQGVASAKESEHCTHLDVDQYRDEWRHPLPGHYLCLFLGPQLLRGILLAGRHRGRNEDRDVTNSYGGQHLAQTHAGAHMRVHLPRVGRECALVRLALVRQASLVRAAAQPEDADRDRHGPGRPVLRHFCPWALRHHPRARRHHPRV